MFCPENYMIDYITEYFVVCNVAVNFDRQLATFQSAQRFWPACNVGGFCV
jgi:uncharacterized protein YjaG (DUF416 family)